jgi:O-antigen ligase
MWLYYLLISTFALQHQRIWNMRVMGYFTVVKLLGLMVVVLALLYGFAKGRMNSLWNKVSGLFLIYFLIAAASHVRALLEHRTTSEAAFTTYLAMMGLMAATLLLVDSWKKVRNALLASWFGVGVGGLYVLREYQLYHNVYPNFRPGWVVGDPNYYGTAVAVCLPMGLVLLDLARGITARLVVLGCFLITGLAFIVSASRGGFVAMAAFGVFAFFRNRNWRKRIVSVGAVAILLMLLYPKSPLYRLISPGASDERSTRYRMELIGVGLEVIRMHPFTGNGLGSFKSVSGEELGGPAKMAHNMYLEISAELGLPALAVFLILIVASWGNLREIRSRVAGDQEMKQLCFAMQGSLVSFMVASVFLMVEYQRYFWLLVFLSVAARRLLKAAEIKGDRSSNRGTHIMTGTENGGSCS